MNKTTSLLVNFFETHIQQIKANETANDVAKYEWITNCLQCSFNSL